MLKELIFNLLVLAVSFWVMRYIMYYYSYGKPIKETRERIIEIEQLYEKFFREELRNEKYFSKARIIRGGQFSFEYKSTKEACLLFEATICDILLFCQETGADKILDVGELKKILDEIQGFRNNYKKII